ncbi:aspartate kinase [Lutimonas zeaxanthinifaciens]|uniref:aspartate kinase n=1 Tax=Lutimonas zeaxanthinifaciens TaxID=3060215 RepID=UPI00265CFD42|nr:aspartate kinase [Lutimonas sp. YSD2104]WKK66300.1 aspartate kinase [Lutimonas sp. YSD2104]
MEIFKFGGASVKDALGVKNFKRVLEKLEAKDVVIVISAMGKMTNAFEGLVRAYVDKDGHVEEHLTTIRNFHLDILDDLDFDQDDSIFESVEGIFSDLSNFLTKNNSTDYDYIYDQVVSKGEMLSTRICSAYLNRSGIRNNWLDVRKCIKTNSDFRRARVHWEATEKAIKTELKGKGITITQGFIGSDNYGRTTTLGREGSDYTAGIFAYCLEAATVSIFKDVPGVLNADPREFDETRLIEQISYKEAIEMAFYGASVIHPKTLQPLQRKSIPLRVRSFLDTDAKGTFVGSELDIVPKTSCYIVKKNQILISISDKEFHFVMENDISEIFRMLHELKLKVNLIQNSALSFSVCIEDNFNNFERLLQNLEPGYKVKYNKNLVLYTVRHFDEKAVDELEKGKELLLKQRSRETVQLIVKA